MSREPTRPTEPPPRADPRVERSRAAIIAAATERFLADGYEADLDDIAHAAGVSKKTIYNVIGSKERLFRETLPSTLSAAERFSAEIGAVLTGAEDVEDALRHAATRLSEVVLSDSVVQLRRLLIGVADRFPALVQDYYERAPGRMLGTLADAFALLQRRGLIDVEDSRLAAEHFAYLAIGASLDRALFGVRGPSRRDDSAARARLGADAFYRAYRPRAERDDRA
jgi:TetR/AcrR family transcriptional regulator, mexJK operon transcriptional repressor